MIPYGKQSIDEHDIAAVVDALRSDWLTTGPKVDEFERQFADYVGAKHAVAVNNGTSALHLAMLVAGIGPGDRVVTSPNTFLASANCAAFVGATPDFSDIDPRTYNLCPKTLAKSWQPDTRAVVAVDYAGQSCDMPTIAEVARSRDALVIEDACHAVGGQFHHEKKLWRVGGHPWADITTFSFHPVKTMTTGEGGMLVTDRDDFAANARVLRHHGMVRDPDACVGLGLPAYDEHGPWYYEMPQLGYNFRITDFQCALGLSQLNRLDEFARRRREIVARYNAAFADIEHVSTPKLRQEEDAGCISWHLYTLRFDFATIGQTRTQVMRKLRDVQIGTQVLYIPVHLQPWYRRTYGYGPGKCPVAEKYYEQTLSIPLYPGMLEADVDRVISAVTSVVDTSPSR